MKLVARALLAIVVLLVVWHSASAAESIVRDLPLGSPTGEEHDGEHNDPEREC